MSNLLIVEDDANIARTLKLFCAEIEKNCFHVKTVAEAVKCVKNNKIDLILLDLLLEGEISTPLIKQLQDLFGVKAPRIVVMSAMTGADAVAKEHDLDFLPKPFELDALELLIG